jgi:hypothetical protein
MQKKRLSPTSYILPPVFCYTSPMQLEPYQPRTIHFVDLFDSQGWKLKVYSILHPDKTLSAPLIEAAKQTALDFLPENSEPGHYGVGFVSVHQGKSYDFVTIGYWTYSTELRHQSYMRASSATATLAPISTELSSDVWDLRLLAFERDAWVTTMLETTSADVNAYLNEQLNETV